MQPASLNRFGEHGGHLYDEKLYEHSRVEVAADPSVGPDAADGAGVAGCQVNADPRGEVDVIA